MTHVPYHELTPYERKIMDHVYRRGSISARDLLDDLEVIPSYSASRAILGVLVDKGQLMFREEGLRYVYYPVKSREEASKQALKFVADTFFGGRPENMVQGLMQLSQDEADSIDVDALEKLISDARKKN